MAEDGEELSLDRTGPDFLLEELEATYLSRPDFADVEVVCGGRRFLAHCAVLAPLSPFLALILRRQHLLAASAGDPVVTVLLPDVSAEEVEALLRLAYSGEAPVESEEGARVLRSTLKMLRANRDVRVEGLGGGAEEADHHLAEDGRPSLAAEVKIRKKQHPFISSNNGGTTPILHQRLNQPQPRPQHQQQQGPRGKNLLPQLSHRRLPPSIVASLKPMPNTPLLPVPPSLQQRKRPLVTASPHPTKQGVRHSASIVVGKGGELLPEVARRLTEQHPQISIQPSRR